MADNALRLLCVSVGNSFVSGALFDGGEVDARGRWSVDEFGPMLEDLRSMARRAAESERGAVVIASVNDPVADRLARELDEDGAAPTVYRVGRDLPIEIVHSLDASGERTVGQDRLLAAIGAYGEVGQACVVVDAGSAVTVDFVDGEGVFHGGAIAPGARMMLRALHERTAALPEVGFEPPAGAEEHSGAPFGKNTPEAMRNGVFFAIRGLVRVLTERYAEAYGAYPLVIATGGDAETLFAGEPLVDRVAPDLVLLGMARLCERALGEERPARSADGG